MLWSAREIKLWGGIHLFYTLNTHTILSNCGFKLPSKWANSHNRRTDYSADFKCNFMLSAGFQQSADLKRKGEVCFETPRLAFIGSRNRVEMYTVLITLDRKGGSYQYSGFKTGNYLYSLNLSIIDALHSTSEFFVES